MVADTDLERLIDEVMEEDDLEDFMHEDNALEGKKKP